MLYIVQFYVNFYIVSDLVRIDSRIVPFWFCCTSAMRSLSGPRYGNRSNVPSSSTSEIQRNRCLKNFKYGYEAFGSNF